MGSHSDKNKRIKNSDKRETRTGKGRDQLVEEFTRFWTVSDEIYSDNLLTYKCLKPW